MIYESKYYNEDDQDGFYEDICVELTNLDDMYRKEFELVMADEKISKKEKLLAYEKRTKYYRNLLSLMTCNISKDYYTVKEFEEKDTSPWSEEESDILGRSQYQIENWIIYDIERLFEVLDRDMITCRYTISEL